jgi:chloride channel protein, CIC family
VVDDSRRLVGVLLPGLLKELLEQREEASRPLGELAPGEVVVAYAGEPLRMVVYRMAETGLTRMPVVNGPGDQTLAGMVSLEDLLHARTRHLEEECRRDGVGR